MSHFLHYVNIFFDKNLAVTDITRFSLYFINCISDFILLLFSISFDTKSFSLRVFYFNSEKQLHSEVISMSIKCKQSLLL